MNRLYTLAALALVSGGLSAQRVAAPKLHHFGAAERTPVAQLPDQAAMDASRDEGDVVFSEDFANGFAGNNGGVGAWTTGLANGNGWVYSHTGPNGAYSDNSEIITSTTVTNGFMIYQSDSLNSNWSNPTNPVIVASPVELVGALISPVIDLSANPYVQLEFQQTMRFCCSNDDRGHFVEVSSDGGATWATRIPVDEGIADNDDSGTHTKIVNITAGIAGDPSQARIRFVQDGTANQITHYHWQVDDIKITVVPMHDLRATAAATYSFNFDAAATFDSVRYTIIPQSQLRTMGLNMTFFNNGQSVETNTTAHFTCDDGFDQNVSVGDMAQGSSETVFADGFVPTNTLGDHNITFSVSADDEDGNPANNSLTDKVTVSQYIYARDDNSRSGNTTNTQNPDEPNAAFLLGNWFHIKEAVTLYGIDVVFATGSDVGSIVNCQLLNDAREPIAETVEHELVSGDLNALNGNHFVTFMFDEPVPLTAGSDILPVVQHFGGSLVRIGVSGVSQAQTSLIKDVPTDTWFYTTSTPMVRLNFDQTAGIEANDIRNGVGLGQSFPNPAKGSAFIDFSLVNSSMVTMQLHDLSGKLVRTLVNGNMAQGAHRVEVNTADLQEGVYFYTLTAGDTRATKRMTVVH